MKAHVGVDATYSLVHAVIGKADNVADVIQVHALLQDNETVVLGDTGYQGMEKQSENIGKIGGLAGGNKAL